jgi:AraC-like DNA-binding protein
MKAPGATEERASFRQFAAVSAAELAGFKSVRELLKVRVTSSFLHRFKRLTGLGLHVLWHRSADFYGAVQPAVFCPAWKQLHGRCPQRCADCLQNHWQPESPHSNGREFVGLCGLRSVWARIQAGPAHVVTIVLQTRKSSVLFADAAALFRMILEELRTTVATAAMEREVLAARERIKTLEIENAHLQRKNRPGSVSDVHGLHASHTQQLVEAMLNYIKKHYNHPMQLGDVASALHMNASYLSSLFSPTLGMTFHEYLEELRLSKAKELLRNPATPVCEVAARVGYTSAGHFWRAFKAQTGFSPRTWRERA